MIPSSHFVFKVRFLVITWLRSLILPLDFTYPDTNENRTWWTRLESLVTAASVTENHQILYALDIPNVANPRRNGPNLLDSGFYAWSPTRKLPGNPERMSFPHASFEWYLAGTQGSSANFCLDGNGLATRLKVITGQVLVLLAYDSGWSRGSNVMLPSRLFSESGFDTAQIGSITPVLLAGGSELYDFKICIIFDFLLTLL